MRIKRLWTLGATSRPFTYGPILVVKIETVQLSKLLLFKYLSVFEWQFDSFIDYNKICAHTQVVIKLASIVIDHFFLVSVIDHLLATKVFLGNIYLYL